MKEFNAETEAKRWVKHASNMCAIKPEYADFIESSLTGWFTVIYEQGRMASSDHLVRLTQEGK